MSDLVTYFNAETAAVDEKNFDFHKYFNRLKTKILGQTVLFEEQTPSTHDIVGKYSQLNGFTAIARIQTAGRGRSCNVWESPRGCALFSFVQHVKLSSFLGQRLSLIQLMIATAVVTGIKKLVVQELDLRLKWPNDIYYGRKEKLGGVILNSTIDEGAAVCLIGVGVNVENDHPTTCVNQIIRSLAGLGTAKEVTIEEVIAASFNEMEKLLELIEKPSGLDLFKKIYLDLWLHTDQQIKTAESREGIVRGIDDYGFLLVEDIETKCLMTAQPDGNRFDMMNNVLIKRVV